MYRWVIGVLVISIIGVGLLVMDSAIDLKTRVNARTGEMVEMLTQVDK